MELTEDYNIDDDDNGDDNDYTLKEWCSEKRLEYAMLKK